MHPCLHSWDFVRFWSCSLPRVEPSQFGLQHPPQRRINLQLQKGDRQYYKCVRRRNIRSKRQSLQNPRPLHCHFLHRWNDFLLLPCRDCSGKRLLSMGYGGRVLQRATRLLIHTTTQSISYLHTQRCLNLSVSAVPPCFGQQIDRIRFCRENHKFNKNNKLSFIANPSPVQREKAKKSETVHHGVLVRRHRCGVVLLTDMMYWWSSLVINIRYYNHISNYCNTAQA